MKNIKLFIILSLLTILNAKEIDPVTGLIRAKGLSDVKENCTICHTGRFIVVNGGDKKFWAHKIKTMHDAYGLWELTKEQKKRIVNYLSTNYNKKRNVSVDE